MANQYKSEQNPSALLDIISFFVSIILFIYLIAEIIDLQLNLNFRYILELIFIPYIILRLNKVNSFYKFNYLAVKNILNLIWSILFLILGAMGIINYITHFTFPFINIKGDVVSVLFFTIGLGLMIFYFKYRYYVKNFEKFRKSVKYLSYSVVFLTIILLASDIYSNLMDFNQINIGNTVTGIFFMDTVFTIVTLVLLAVFIYLIWHPEYNIIETKNFLVNAIPNWYLFLIISIFYIVTFIISLMVNNFSLTRDLFQGLIRNALFTGSIYLLLGIGLTLVYKILNFANFAHGELIIFGSYFSIVFLYGVTFNFLGSALGFIASLIFFMIIVFIASGMLALVGDALVFRPLRKKNSEPYVLMIASIGLSIVFRYSMINYFGARSKGLPLALLTTIPLNVIKVLVFFIAIILVILLEMLLKKTKWGKAMRAMSDNKNLAQVCGISPTFVIILVWVIGAGLAGIGGLLQLLKPGQALSPSLGFNLLLPTFAVVILGGIGSYRGAIVAGYIIGFAEQFGTFILIYFGNIKNNFIINLPILLGNLTIQNFQIAFSFSQDYQISIGFIILIFVLLVRPTGIFGEEVVKER